MSAGYLEKVSMKKKGKEKENEEKLETVYIEDESGLGSGPPQPQTGEGAPPVGVIAVEIKEACRSIGGPAIAGAASRRSRKHPFLT